MVLRIIFAGTPEFAATHLQALLDSEHSVLAAFTQPDRPAGRGRHLSASPVKALALEKNIPVHQPLNLKEEATQTLIKNFNADLWIVVAYGLILPKAVLSIPPLGCINVHASLLPKWRGAAPIQRAIEAGDGESGVTIMQMDEGLDTGGILLQSTQPISSTTTSADLFKELAAKGALSLVQALSLLEQGKLIAKPQNSVEATYASKITKAEAQLDWNLSAQVLANKVRAFNPWPVAFTEFQGQVLRVWQAKALDQETKQAPGSLVALTKEGIDIQCARGVLRLLEVQAAGKKVQAVSDFVNARLENRLS